MNVLDGNVPQSQQDLPKRWRIHVRQIRDDAGRKGMKDREIIPLVLEFNRPTFFTLDRDFYSRRLCHDDYRLVFFRSRRRSIRKLCPPILAASSTEIESQKNGKSLTRIANGIYVLANPRRV
jgi:hypothetical protein